MKNMIRLKTRLIKTFSYKNKNSLFNIQSKDYFLYAIYCIINSLGSNFVTNAYHNNVSIVISYISGAMCVFLLLYETWTHNIKKYIVIYWYITLLYTLPLYSMFMVLNTSCSRFSIINFGLSALILMTLVDWIKFFYLMLIGISLGIGLYIISNGVNIKSLLLMNGFFEVIYMLIMIMSVAHVFLKKQQQFCIKTLSNMRLLAAGIAHEIRTPLASLMCNINLLKKDKRQGSSEIINEISFNITQCHHIMNSMLLNLKNKVSANTSINNVYHLVTTSINEYPLEKQEKKHIFISINKDLKIIVDPLLFKQVVFNLLNNALFYIKKKGDGVIHIYTQHNHNKVTIVFKDTGTGIPKNKISSIFQAFKSDSNIGNSIGLAFCKYVITKMNGTINCSSVYGKYTKFNITFFNHKKFEKE